MLRIIIITIGLSVCGIGVWTCHQANLKPEREAEIKQSFGRYLAPEKNTGW